MSREAAPAALSGPLTASGAGGHPTGHPAGSGAQIASYVWGVDPSTRRVAIAAAGPSRGVTTIEVGPNLRTGARLSSIYDQVRAGAAEFAVRFPPVYVWVEQIAVFSRRVDPELYYAVGVVQAALYAALSGLYPHPVEVRTVPVATWKVRSVGHGHAKKPQVLAWARRNGYVGDVQDEADAWAIAHAGRMLLEPRPEQLELAG